MAVKTLAELKQRFETGDIPQAQDFIDFMDSFLHAGLGNFPNPLPAVSGAALENIGDALPDPLPARDGSQLTNINPQEYNVPGAMPLPSYATANTFVLSGDFTVSASDPADQVFLLARRLRIQIGGAYEYTEVSNAVFSAGITTVTTLNAMSGSPIQKVAVGVITPFALGGAVGATAAGAVSLTKNETVGGNKTLTGDTTCSGTVTMNGKQFKSAQGANIASGATVDLSAATGNFVTITHSTGTTSISSFGTVQAGAEFLIKFSISGGTLNLTYNGTSMLIDGAADISPLTNGAMMRVVSLGSGNWRVLDYKYARTWQDMTGVGGRAVTADIQNKSGIPIELNIGFIGATGGSVYFNCSLFAGVSTGSYLEIHKLQKYASTSETEYKAVQGTIPHGGWYKTTAGNMTIDKWMELR